ncbi:MAG: ornithine--oxo-acid transaminase [Candidatus Eiseniibacteriota bacterium]
MATQTTHRFIELAEKHSAHNYHPLPVVLERGRGVWVWDPEGRKYLDLLAAYSAVNQGHCHPRIVAALKEQADRITLTSRAFHNDQFGPLCELLTSLSGYDKALLMNTGAEAVETAVKVARKWGYTVKRVPADRAEIVVCAGNFHGRTTTIVGFSSEPQYREGFGPFTPGFRMIPYGDADALEEAMSPNTVAFLVEPIQGEAGIVVPPAGFLAKAQSLCRKHGALLIADEIQSGLGRTGRLFAYEWEGVRPDALIVGKALAGGLYPVSAFLANDDVMGVLRPGDHGSTFGGNPLGCAVARAALEVIRDERLAERSHEMGLYFDEKLRALPQDTVREIRGRGLWIGIEIRKECGPARPYCEALMERGILAKETHEQVVRIAPPLVISRDDIDWAVPRIGEVLAERRG